jgi:hypothetical protein
MCAEYFDQNLRMTRENQVQGAYVQAQNMELVSECPLSPSPYGAKP